jgi:gluconolactonase
MKKNSISAALLCALIAGTGAVRAQTADGKPAVVKIDPSFDALVSPDAKLQMVKTGYGFVEGIVWVQKKDQPGYLLLSDMPANVIFKLTPDGEQSLFLDRSGYTGYDIWRVGFIQNNGRDKSDPKYEEFPMIGSNGLTLDPEGRLLIATWTGRSIDRIEHDGKRTILAARYEGKRFGGTNDLVSKKNGTIYFTDGYNGMRLRDKDPSKELDFRGVFMLKNGKVTRIAPEVETPNGLALSPDEKYLYLNNGGMKIVRRYEVQADDTPVDPQVFFDMSADTTPGIADGMKVDIKGNLYESGPGGIWVISPEGKLLGKILTPELVANLTFGDPDHKTLYIVARSSVYKIRLNTAGIP